MTFNCYEFCNLICTDRFSNTTLVLILGHNVFNEILEWEALLNGRLS